MFTIPGIRVHDALEWMFTFGWNLRSRCPGIRIKEAWAAPGPERASARYAAVTRASILGLSGGLFSAAARPGQRPATLFGANVALENRD